MAKHRRKKHLLGISDKGWDTIGKGFKWWLIAGAIATGVVLVVGVGAVAIVGAKGGLSGAALPPVRIL